MAALKDFKCEKHGYFESRKAECPMKGCDAQVHVVFLQAPGLKSDRTKNTDKTLKGLAKDFGMTNIKSTREGEHQTGYLSRNNIMTEKERAAEAEAAAFKNREPRAGDAAIWGGAGGMNMDNLLKGNMFRPVADESVGINPKAAGNLTGPKAASYIADHDNLQVKP